MIGYGDNRLAESSSPHSLGNRVAMTIPNPGFDGNPLMIEQKRFWGAGIQGMGGLSFDGTGLLGTGLFSGDMSSWGITEIILGLVGAYAVYSMIFQAKQTNYRLQGAAQKRRKSKAVKYREAAKRLEAAEVGGWFA